MLEYTKTILQKIDFSTLLFKKELKKSITWLNHQEQEELYRWVKSKYGSKYDDEFLIEKNQEEVKASA
ncbi:MAG: hypothetical protein ACNS62_04875 [Candidatus Cyclobacteriaceae bacterium M3_2C_046]